MYKIGSYGISKTLPATRCIQHEQPQTSIKFIYKTHNCGRAHSQIRLPIDRLLYLHWTSVLAAIVREATVALACTAVQTKDKSGNVGAVVSTQPL